MSNNSILILVFRNPILVTRISDLESLNLSLNQKISDMAQKIEDDRASHRAQV